MFSEVGAFFLVDVSTTALNLAAVRSGQENGSPKTGHVRFFDNLLLGLGLLIRLDAAHCEAHAVTFRVHSRLLDYIICLIDSLG